MNLEKLLSLSDDEIALSTDFAETLTYLDTCVDCRDCYLCYLCKDCQQCKGCGLCTACCRCVDCQGCTDCHFCYACENLTGVCFCVRGRKFTYANYHHALKLLGVL